jgi:hypothetical protein
MLGNCTGMTTSSEQSDSSVQAEPAGMSLQTDATKAMVAEIKAENEALKETDRVAEMQVEAAAEQAKQLAQMTEEVLEELKEMQEEGGAAGPA